MLGKFTKSWMVVIYLLLGIALGFGIGVGYMRIRPIVEKTQDNKTNDYSKSPRKKLVIVIQKSQQEELFNQFQTFAHNNGFAIRIAPNTPSGEDFSIEMWREDIMVFGANPFDPGEFRIGFYNTDGANPYPMPEGELNALVGDFKSLISDIPNATISEEK